jgi:addiction module HigA family antidote
MERLVREETPVTTDTALRLARYLGTTAEFWLKLQARFDLETARQTRNDDIAAIKPRKAS